MAEKLSAGSATEKKMFRRAFPAGKRSEGPARLTGKISADPANTAYPYQMKADKVEFLKQD